ncbi:MAG: hypothetical protein LQ348_003790 [Seirophora lacunosa]|nr:MAG: hypothetical protein LQ348_003790 [Seirophora lacunosa]
MTEHEVPSRAKTMEVSNKHDLLVPSSSHQGREPSATLMDSAEKQDEESAGHLKGLRLHFTTAALCLCLFLTNLEIPIVTTALVGITDDLGGFDRSSWIISAYLLGYVGAVAALIIIVCIPNGFPNQLRSDSEKSESARTNLNVLLGRVDVLGTAMLLVATTLLVAALQEAGTAFSWKSAFVIILLTISGLIWPAFLIWDRRVTLIGKEREPIFPRLQLVNNLNPLEAGLRFIPFTIAAPVGSIIAPTIAKTAKVPPIYLVVFASVVQVVGFALLSTLPTSDAIARAQYGYEFLAGFGCGINITLLILMTPWSVEERDKAVAMSSVAQFRVMGGVIGLAIVTAALNGLVRSKLRGILSHAQIEELLRSAAAIASTSAADRDQIRSAFAEGYNLQMKILAGLAAAQIPSSLVMWQKKQIVV